MTNVSHASLTGSQLHEPKGVSTASLGQVYVANGAGSGTWSDVGTASFTGMIADFTWPVVQSGWLELDGSVISSTTYSALYNVMTIQQNGTRTNGSAIVTSLTSTTNIKAGYYVYGTGIASGTTVSSVDSATQITMSATASSSGTATVVVSPWLVASGTIKLPDVSTAGRYRRSRTSTTAVGQVQADQNQAHTHDSGTVTSSAQSVDHTHTQGGTFTSGGQSATHTHGSVLTNASVTTNGTTTGGVTPSYGNVGSTGNASGDHTHSVTISGQTGGVSAGHTHTVSFTTTSNGGTEARPLTLIVMTCVKT